jgi:polygalacturonase
MENKGGPQGQSCSWSRDLKTWTDYSHTKCGENACVLIECDEYVMMYSPKNGMGIKRSKDLIHWRDEGEVITLGQDDWPWAEMRLTAGFVLDLREQPQVVGSKYLLFFHGGGPGKKRTQDNAFANCSIGIAWSDDLKKWNWPGDAATQTAVSEVPGEIAPIHAPFAMPQLQRPVFPDRTFNITGYGAKGDGTTKNTEAFRKAIEACHKAGGGKVLVPAGKWLTGAIHLKSNVNLHMLEGAEIHFSDNPQDYLPMVFTRWAGTEVMNYSPLIYANGCENIAVTGPGTLYGHGKNWWGWEKRLNERDTIGPKLQAMAADNTPVEERVFGSPELGLRPQFISPINCRNVLLEGFTIAEPGPFWTIQFVYCENVIARGLTLHTKGGPNTDGINLDSTRNALVEHCMLDVGDDAVCLKSGINEDGRRVGRPTENVGVRNITAFNCHGGIVIGSEMSGGVRNVLAYDCTYDGSDIGIRLKSNAARGGVVENITYRDITMRKIRYDAIKINTNYSAWGAAKNATHYPTFRNITFKDISCEDVRWAVSMNGSSHQPIANVTLENVSIKANSGMNFNWIDGLKLINVTSTPKSGEPMSFRNCTNVVQK